MIKHYYTYDDLVVLLSCSKRTLERLIPKMNITKRTFGAGRKVLFLVLDVHAYLEFNKNYFQCTTREKQVIKELVNHE